MDDKHIIKLESQIEHLVEGAFTQLFRKRVSAHDIAIKLARSMEDNLRYAQVSTDPRPIAPDDYAIHLSPAVYHKLQELSPSLATVLQEQLIELAVQSGYRLTGAPVIKLIANNELDEGEVAVHASHNSSKEHSTAAMQPIRIPKPAAKPRNSQLIIGNERTIRLTQPVINIGRSHDNHIILDDPRVSRHHVQIRLRFGKFTLFDVNSRGGTFVNNVRVAEHHLQAGDVIKIGNTQMIYVSDDERGHTAARTTSSLDPVD